MQTKPIRGATGADITESSLRKTLQNLGIKKEIRDLSYVEKRLVIVISLTEQLKNAQGDLSRTIESTANQLKIMQQQLQRLKIAFGDFFNIFVGKVLPYLNGFLMALVEIIKFITELTKKLLGIEDTKFDYSGLGGENEYLDELTDGLEEANDETEKLKKSLIGIDELNILQPQEEESNMDIDPEILNAFLKAMAEWDNKMDETEMKAYKIRDAILSWFGLQPNGDGWGLLEGNNLATRLKNTLEGIKLDDLKQNIGDIAGAIGAVLGTMLAIKILLNPYLLIAYGIYKIIQGIQKLLDETKSKVDGIRDIIEGLGFVIAGFGLLLGNLPMVLIGGILIAIAEMSKLFDTTQLEKLITMFEEWITGLPDLLSGLGVALIIPFIANAIFAGVTEGLKVAASAFSGTGFISIINAIKSGFGAAFATLTPIFLKVSGVASILLGIADVIRGVIDMIKEGKVTLESLSKVLKGIGLIIAGFGLLTGNPLAIAIGAIVAVIGMVADKSSETGKVIMNLWDNVLKPVIDKLAEHLKRLWVKLEPALKALWNLIKGLWDILMVLVGLIVDLIGPTVEVLASLFLDVLGGALGTIIDIIRSLLEILGGVVDFVAGVLTGDLDRAFKGIGNIFVGFINGILTVVELCVNSIITIVNSVLGLVLGVIKGVWNLLAGVIEIALKIFGINANIKWTGGVPQIPLLTIPKVNTFENGGYPDRGMFLMNEGSSAEMLGTIGGRTAVVNNEEIAEALARALTPLLGTVVAAVEDVAASDRPVILSVDSREIARANTNGEKRLGTNQVGGVFANV